MTLAELGFQGTQRQRSTRRNRSRASNLPRNDRDRQECSLQFAAQGSTETTLIQEEIVFVLLLLIVSGVAILVRKVRIPYTVALVLAGLALAILPTEGIITLPKDVADPLTSALRGEVTSQLILALLVPPLIFEAALRLNLKTLRKEWLPIFLLAVPGVLISTAIVGNVVEPGRGHPHRVGHGLRHADLGHRPVAVIAFFRSVGVDKRLSTLIEGESLLNDGVAVVLFSLALATTTALSGGSSANPTVLQGVLEFIRVAGGGILVGLATGFLVAQVIGRLNDPLVETTLSMALAVGSFVVARTIDVSGILAVLTAGLVIGSLDLKQLSPPPGSRCTTSGICWRLSPTRSCFSSWDYKSPLAGWWTMLGTWRLPCSPYWSAGPSSSTAASASTHAGQPTHPDEVPARHVLGGLRGAVGLALALSLTGRFPRTCKTMTFGVVSSRWWCRALASSR